MFKIGEFSQIGQVSVRMLRHYDKMGLLKPEQVDHFTGYRYYTLEQLPRLHRLLALKDFGFSLEQIGDLLHQDLSPEQLRGMLTLKRAEIARSLEEEGRRLARIEARLRQIERGGAQPAYEVIMKHAAPLPLVATRQTVPAIDDMPHYRCAMFEAVYTWLGRYGAPPAGPELVIYHTPDYTEENVDMEVAVPLAADVFAELAPHAAGEMSLYELAGSGALAGTVHQGNLYDICDAIAALFGWAHHNRMAATGPLREIHLSGREDGTMDESNVLFEMQLPVAQV